MKKFISIFFLISISKATTYYVDKDGVHGTVGNDNYSGTSWSQPWATITKAAQTLQAGDTVIVAPGIYRETVTPLNSGTSGNWIVYLGEQGAEIAGSEPVDESQFQKLPGYNYVYYMIFNDFPVKGIIQRNGNDSIVLSPYYDDDDTILNTPADIDTIPGSFVHRNDTLFIHTPDHLPPDSLLHNIELVKRNYGIRVENKSYIQFEGFKITGVSAFRGTGYGIFLLKSHYITLLNDTVIGSVIRGSPPYSGRGNTHIRVENCSSSRTWRISSPFGYGMLPHGMAGISFADADTVLIKNCEIWWQTDAAALKGDCDSVVIENTKWWDCPNHGFKLIGSDTGERPNNIVFKGCEAGANCQEGIYIYYSDNITVENCDFFSIRQFPPETTNYSTNIKIVNTILTKRLWIAESSVDEYETDYNCIYDPDHPSQFILIGTQHYTLSEWQQLSGNDLHSLNEDPQVVNWGEGPGHPDSDFYLLPISPCIDAGDPSYPPPPGGGSRIDIGAYEYIQHGNQEEEDKKHEQSFPTILTNIELFKSIKKFDVLDISGRKVDIFKTNTGKYFIILKKKSNTKKVIPVIFLKGK